MFIFHVRLQKIRWIVTLFCHAVAAYLMEDVLGGYPYHVEERDDELVIHFDSKETPGRGTVFNLRFRITDRYRRDRIKTAISELASIDK